MHAAGPGSSRLTQVPVHHKKWRPTGRPNFIRDLFLHSLIRRLALYQKSTWIAPFSPTSRLLAAPECSFAFITYPQRPARLHYYQLDSGMSRTLPGRENSTSPHHSLHPALQNACPPHSLPPGNFHDSYSARFKRATQCIKSYPFKIGIGGRVAPPPLPHHRTCGSASGGSAD
jgi:hypothetical protein